MTHGENKRVQILEFLIDYIDKHNYAPSIIEIGVAVGLRSKATISSHLYKMEKKGVIRRKPFGARAIEVVRPRPKEHHLEPFFVEVKTICNLAAAGVASFEATIERLQWALQSAEASC